MESGDYPIVRSFGSFRKQSALFQHLLCQLFILFNLLIVLNQLRGCIYIREIVYTQLRARHVHLLILAEDIGDNAKKKLNDKCSFYKVPCVYMDGALMNMAIGDRNRKAIAILDKGFAEKIAACLKG